MNLAHCIDDASHGCHQQRAAKSIQLCSLSLLLCLKMSLVRLEEARGSTQKLAVIKCAATEIYQFDSVRQLSELFVKDNIGRFQVAVVDPSFQ